MIGGGYALIHFPEKPLVGVHETLYGLLHKCLRIAATVGGQAIESGLQVRIKTYFHAPKGTGGERLMSSAASSPSSPLGRYWFTPEARKPPSTVMHWPVM
jgi:hypothetical protein